MPVNIIANFVPRVLDRNKVKSNMIENNVYSTFNNCTVPFNDVVVIIR